MFTNDQLAAWFRSSYSAAQGNCVEVAHVPADFHKSSYSGIQSNCLEVARTPGAIAVRDSKHPEAGHLAFGPPEWTALVAALRTGEL